jgi:hypothetical protein
MKLEEGKCYIRKDFTYSAIILIIIYDDVTYEFCNIKDGSKGMWTVNSAQFKKKYSPASNLLKELL